MIRFIAPDEPEPESGSASSESEPELTGTVVVGAQGIILPERAPTGRQAPPVKGVTPSEEFDTLVLALKGLGYTAPEIAEMVQDSERRVYRSLSRSRKRGLLANDVVEDLQHDILPLAVEQLRKRLQQGDDVVQTLKGLGAFRSFTQKTEHRDSEHLSRLEVVFELPDDRPALMLNPTNIVGRPVEAGTHGQTTDGGEGQRDSA
jgi:transposase